MRKLRIEAGLQPATRGDNLVVEMSPSRVADLISGLSHLLSQKPAGTRSIHFSLFGEITQHVEGWVPLNTVPATVAAVPVPPTVQDEDE